MHTFSMTNSQPWAKSCNFEGSVVNFEVILKRLCNDYANVVLTKNTLKHLEIARRFSNFQNYLNNSLKTASIWPHRNIWRTLYIKKTISLFVKYTSTLFCNCLNCPLYHFLIGQTGSYLSNYLFFLSWISTNIGGQNYVLFQSFKLNGWPTASQKRIYPLIT